VRAEDVDLVGEEELFGLGVEDRLAAGDACVVDLWDMGTSVNSSHGRRYDEWRTMMVGWPS